MGGGEPHGSHSLYVSLPFPPSSPSAAGHGQDSLCPLCAGQSCARDGWARVTSCPSHPPPPIACLPTCWHEKGSTGSWACSVYWASKGRGIPSWENMDFRSEQRIPCWQRLGTAGGKHLKSSNLGFLDWCRKNTGLGAQSPAFQAPLFLHLWAPRTVIPHTHSWEVTHMAVTMLLWVAVLKLFGVRTLKMLKNYWGPQKAFVYVGYVYWYLPYWYLLRNLKILR